MSRIRQFGHQRSTRCGGYAGAEANKGSRTSEHACTRGHALNDSTNHHDDGTDKDGPSAAKAIRDVWGNRHGSDAANRLHSRKESQLRSGGIAELWSAPR